VQRNNVSAVLSVLAAGLLWGTVGPAELLAKSPAGPVTVGGARILSGGIVLAVVALVASPGAVRALPRTAWLPILAASCATATFQGAFFTSTARTGAAVATAVTFGIAPLSTGLCDRLMLGTGLPRRWMTGTACAVAGCVVIAVPGGLVHVDGLGLACGVLAGGCFGVYTVSAKRLIGDGVSMIAAVPLTLLIGGAVLSPWTLPELPELVAPRSLGLVAWLGPVTVALAYWLFVTGLRHITAATAGTLSLAEPLVATALATGLLGEHLSARVAVGSLLLLGGLTIVSVPWPSRTDGGSSAVITPRADPDSALVSARGPILSAAPVPSVMGVGRRSSMGGARRTGRRNRGW
jgi:drug/metabolite transporter, DME family